MTVSPGTFEKVWERDAGQCVRCGLALVGARGLSWSVHHRRPRGSGGSKLKWVDLPGNLILLCGSGVTGCHGWVESHRAVARDKGWLVPLNGIRLPSAVPVHHALHGVVVLNDMGTYDNQEVIF